MNNQQINCDDCEFLATSTNDMENLVNLEHKGWVTALTEVWRDEQHPGFGWAYFLL